MRLQKIRTLYMALKDVIPMSIDTSRDLFLYSRITKTEKPKSNSGTHTSSSGRSHGGRGGSF